MQLSLTLWRSPAAQLASKLNTNDLWSLDLPWQVCHNVNGISTTNTDSGHSETTGVWSVRVGTNHETTGESVVLEDCIKSAQISNKPSCTSYAYQSGG